MFRISIEYLLVSLIISSLLEPAEPPTGVTTTVINSTVTVKWDAAQDVRGLLLGYKVALMKKMLPSSYAARNSKSPVVNLMALSCSAASLAEMVATCQTMKGLDLKVDIICLSDPHLEAQSPHQAPPEVPGEAAPGGGQR